MGSPREGAIGSGQGSQGPWPHRSLWLQGGHCSNTSTWSSSRSHLALGLLGRLQRFLLREATSGSSGGTKSGSFLQGQQVCINSTLPTV